MPERVFQALFEVPESIRGEMNFDGDNRIIEIFRQSSERERSSRVAAVAHLWRQHKTFKLLKGWRYELWPVYSRRGELLFSIERAAVGLFGTMRYGVHMSAFVRDESAPYGLKLWVPRRAANKSTFPGMLDNTVAGGLMTGEDPLECIIREADEEASLPNDIVRGSARNVGTVTYIYVSREEHVGESGYIYPECQWVYDLQLPASIVPRPQDGEAEYFSLCSIAEVKRDLRLDRFKPNCALVIIDFFIRNSILEEDEMRDLEAIRRRIHRDIRFPGPHHSDWSPF